MGSLVDDQLANAENEFIDRRNSIIPEITDPSALLAERVVVNIGNLTLSGFVSQGGSVANFRNIQYGHIAGRWHEAKLFEAAEHTGFIDATQWGPRAPQELNHAHRDTGHLYPRMSLFDRQSEFECLNLNIYAPLDAVKKGENKETRLPVMVWIHGGSFEFGDGGCEFDGQYLVKRSINLDQPVIVVGINYRLGVLGFFTSHELREEARARGEAGYSNLGFADQRLALEWVAKYISFFGGDCDRITLAGESAGAISVLAHIRGNVPVAQNALAMSPGSVVPVSHETTQQTFDNLVKKLGVADAPDVAKLAAIRSVPAIQLQRLTTNRTEHILSEDPEFFSDYEGERFEKISVMPSWLKRVVVGDLKEENAPLAGLWSKVPPETLLDKWTKLYGDDSGYAGEVMATYGIVDVNQSNIGQEVAEALVSYTSDALFSFATVSVATSHLSHLHEHRPGQTKVYQYRFDQPDILSPSPAHRNRVYHSMDNVFLFCHPRVAGPEAPKEFKVTCEEFSGAALRLINGNGPWEDVGVSRRFMTFDGSGSRLRPESESFAKRWTELANTPERMDRFLLGKEFLWGSVAFDIHADLQSK